MKYKKKNILTLIVYFFHDVWIVNDDQLMLHDEINRRWITISIAKIKSIRIYEKIIF